MSKFWIVSDLGWIFLCCWCWSRKSNFFLFWRKCHFSRHFRFIIATLIFPPFLFIATLIFPPFSASSPPLQNPQSTPRPWRSRRLYRRRRRAARLLPRLEMPHRIHHLHTMSDLHRRHCSSSSKNHSSRRRRRRRQPYPALPPPLLLLPQSFIAYPSRLHTLTKIISPPSSSTPIP